MKDIFAALFENFLGVFDSNFSLIFNTLYDDGGYFYMGLTFILVPFLLWLPFYYLWKYPYATFLHWIFWLLVTLLFVFGITWWIADNEIFFSHNSNLIEALADPDSGFDSYARSLPLQYAMYNTILSIVVGFVCSITMKLKSKIQMHLPF